MTTPTTSGASAPDTFVAGSPIWTDLATSDLSRAEDFYGQVFGWTIRNSGEDYGGYVFFYLEEDMVAGMIGNRPESGFPDMWTTYLASPDARQTSAAAPGAGGSVVIEPVDVRDLGVMALLRDPGAATVGIWQPGAHRGFGTRGRAGAPVWHELHAREYPATVRFYEQAFGWHTSVMSDTPEFRYTLLVDDAGGQLAGVVDATADLPEGAPAGWYTYWGSADVDATLATIEGLGGRVVQPAVDTAYGRLAEAADPTGATFKLSSLRA